MINIDLFRPVFFFPFRKSCYTYIMYISNQYYGNIANQRLHLPSIYSVVNMLVQEHVHIVYLKFINAYSTKNMG